MGKSFSGYTVQKNTTKYFLILEYHSLKQGTLYDKMGKEFMKSEKTLNKGEHYDKPVN